MPVKIIFSQPKQVDDLNTAIGAEAHQIRLHPDMHEVYTLRGDPIRIPFDGLSEEDRAAVAAYMAIVARETEFREAEARSLILRQEAARAAEAEQAAAEAELERIRKAKQAEVSPEERAAQEALDQATARRLGLA